MIWPKDWESWEWLRLTKKAGVAYLLHLTPGKSQ